MLRFLTLRHHVFVLKFTLHNVAAKTGNDVSLVLKDSDTESENLSSLIWLSVSDSQKTESSKDVSIFTFICRINFMFS